MTVAAAPRRTRSLFALVALFAVAALALAGCGTTEETEPDTVGSDTTGTDDTGNETPLELSGQDRTYRFTALKLDKPDISQRQILNALIDTAIKRPASEEESVHVLLRFSAWDTATEPPSLTLEAGAGAPEDALADPIVYGFRPDAELVAVSAVFAPVEGLYKIRNEAPTNLIFPLTVSGNTTLLPLRDIRLDTCFGTGATCTGTTEDEIFGTLTGGIIAAEADSLMVELQEGAEPIPLGDLLRDAREDLTCTADADCTGLRTSCNAAGHCERAPDMEVEGQPAYELAGTFKAAEVPFAAP